MELTVNILYHVLLYSHAQPFNMHLWVFFFHSSSPNVVSSLVAGRAGYNLLFIPSTHGLSKSGDFEPINIQPCLTLNQDLGPLSLPCHPIAPSTSLPRTLDSSILFQGQGAEEYIGLENESRKVCLLCVYWSIYTGTRCTAGPSYICVLPSRVCTYVGQYL